MFVFPLFLLLFSPIVLSRKRVKTQIRKDPIKSHRPNLPTHGPTAVDKEHERNSFTAYIMQSHIKNTLLEEDPREALLKYAKESEGHKLLANFPFN